MRPAVPLCALMVLTSCGSNSLLGVKNSFQVSATVDNQSDYAATVALELSEGSSEDVCEADSAKKDVDVPAKSQREDSLNLKCEHPPRTFIEATLRVPPDPTNLLQWATVTFDENLTAALAAATEVRWHVDQATVRSGVISAADYIDTNGVRSPAKDATSVSTPTAEIFAAAPVRADGRLLEIYFAPDAAALDIGLPTRLFSAKPANALTEVDGFYYFQPKIETFSGVLKLRRGDSAAKVTCTNTACTFAQE